jgi:hypothetical protein
MLRIPQSLDSRLTDGGKVVSTYAPAAALIPRNITTDPFLDLSNQLHAPAALPVSTVWGAVEPQNRYGTT